MAHNLTVTNGKVEMAYFGERPWHELGTALPAAATSAEAIEAAGLDWTVSKRKMWTEGPNKQLIPMLDRFAIVRDDTHFVTGSCGSVWEPLQNKDAFRFFDAVVGEKAAMYHTAGSLGGGERVWMLAKVPGEMLIAKNDPVEKFLLLTNSHKGGEAVDVLFTPIRVVCQNTLNVALNGNKGEGTHIRLRHCAGMGMRVDEVRNTLGIIGTRFALFEKAAKELAAAELVRGAWTDYLKKVFRADQAEAKMAERTRKVLAEVTALFEGAGKGSDLDGSRGTAWGAFNAVAEFADYHRGTRGGSDADRQNNRAESLLFGSGAGLKQRAFAAALALTK